MDVVAAAFEKLAKEKAKYKPVTVDKLIELEFDVGTLLASDTNELDETELNTNTDAYLLHLARDNTQLLLNKVWELPAEKVEETIVSKLPKPVYMIPREKPVPKKKAMTKWESFAKEKGLQKKKKAKVTWDDILEKWVPTHGYRRAAAEKDKNWLIEVPVNADPYEDQFEKKTKAHSERVAKNEFSRLRNIAAARNIKVPHMGILTSDKLNATGLETAAGIAKLSTASLGKFQPKLRKEKTVIKQKNMPGAQKRKIAVVPAAQEKASNLELLEGILKKKPKLDVEKAVNRQVYAEQAERSEEKQDVKGKGKGKGKRRGGGKKGSAAFGGGAGKKGKSVFKGKKPPAGRGRRNPHTKTTGRKRR